MIQQKDVIY